MTQGYWQHVIRDILDRLRIRNVLRLRYSVKFAWLNIDHADIYRLGSLWSGFNGDTRDSLQRPDWPFCTKFGFRGPENNIHSLAENISYARYEPIGILCMGSLMCMIVAAILLLCMKVLGFYSWLIHLVFSIHWGDFYLNILSALRQGFEAACSTDWASKNSKAKFGDSQ